VPAQRTSTRTTKPAATPRATSTTKATDKPAAATRASSTKATTAKANGKPQGNRRQAKPKPFREVTLVSESYLAIQGLDDQDFDLATCPRCASLVPSGEAAETAHREWHDEIDRIIEQLTEAVHGLESQS
jgi:hypothetical protein